MGHVDARRMDRPAAEPNKPGATVGFSDLVAEGVHIVTGSEPAHCPDMDTIVDGEALLDDIRIQCGFGAHTRLLGLR